MKRFLVIALVLMSMASLSGCGAKKVEAVENNKTVRVGTFTGLGAYWNEQLYVAYEKDYFSDYGIQVEISDFANGPAATEAFLAGEIDLTSGIGDQPVISSIANNVETSVLASLSKQEKNIGIITPKDSGITSVTELKGKKIGVYIGTYIHKSLIGLLSEEGISPEEVEIYNIQSVTDADAAFQTGEIDAYLPMSGKYVADRVGSGEYILLRDCTGYPAITYLTALTSFVEDNPEVTADFLQALADAQKFIEENPEEAEQLVAKFAEVEAETVHGVLDGVDVKLELEQDEIQNLYDTYQFMLDNGMTTVELTKEVIDQHIDSKYIANIK